MTFPNLVIASLPGVGGVNPYIDLFYNALSPHGVTLYQPPVVDSDWGRNHFKSINALHFHWPEYIWRQSPPPRERSHFRSYVRTHFPGAWRIYRISDSLSRLERVKRAHVLKNRALSLLNFRQFLRQAKHARVRIIWTAHNLESHENFDVVDRAGFRLLARYADLIICHGSYSKLSLERTHRPKCPIVVMPHGNYDGIYPPPRPRELVLAELGLDSKIPVVGCVGAIRGYKGVDLACQAVKTLEGSVQLLCAGAPHGLFSLQEFQSLIDSTPGAVFVPRQLTNEEFSDYCAACDVILLPYRKITGSGALLASLTMARGVVASDLAFFREILAGTPDAGILVEPGSAKALADGIKQYLGLSRARREYAARELAKTFDWSHVIAPVVAEMKSLRQQGSDVR